MVQRIRGRDCADQNEHDQPHALLSVVGAVGEADARAGQDQQAADPERRRFVAFRRFIEAPVFDHSLADHQQHRSHNESDQRRDQQRLADIGSLAPVDAAGALSAPT